jgi:hypothetical protein
MMALKELCSACNTATDENVVRPPAKPGIQKVWDKLELDNRNPIKPAMATPAKLEIKIAMG